MPNFGGTITSGIQDVSALLPLIGTEQCERHVGCALTGGYLYAVATPLSIFGSLGIFKAGFVALIASFSVGGICGAMKLADAGFEATGSAISMITIDQGRYVAETRLLSMLRDQHIDNVENLTLEWNCRSWNWRMVRWSLIGPILSFTPYLYFILRDHSNHTTFTTWTFPIARAVGGFLSALMVQFVIQHRVMTILKKRLVFMTMEADVESYLMDREAGVERAEADAERLKAMEAGMGKVPFKWSQDSTSEMCLWSINQYFQRMGPSLRLQHLQGKLDGEMRKHFPTTERRLQMWAFQICRLVLFIGLGFSLIGYVGCFSIVQGSQNAAGPPLWLGLESALSFLRMMLWTWNPDFDDDTHIRFKLKLVAQKPFITCDRFFEEMERDSVFPVVREQDFLEEITSCIGPLPRFADNNVSLYYTHSTTRWGTTRRVLCITVFDYKERDSVTLVQTFGSSNQSRFFTSSLNVNSTDGTLAAKVIAEIDPEANYITADEKFLRALRDHCDSIVQALERYEVGKEVEISTRWVLAIRGEPRLTGRCNSETVLDDSGYVEQMELDRRKVGFAKGAGEWISSYIAQTNLVAKDGGTIPETAVFLAEWDAREHMLLVESMALEQQLRQHSSEIFNGMNNDGRMNQRFSREWAKNVENRLVEETQQFQSRCANVRSVVGLDSEPLDQTEAFISAERRKTLNLKELTDNAPLTAAERWNSVRVRLIEMDGRFEEKKHSLLARKPIGQDIDEADEIQQRFWKRWNEMEDRLRKEKDALVVRLYVKGVLLFSKASEWNFWDFHKFRQESIAGLDKLGSKYFTVSHDDDLALLVAAGHGPLSRKIDITAVHFQAWGAMLWDSTEALAAFNAIKSITSFRNLPLTMNVVIEVLRANKSIMSADALMYDLPEQVTALLEHNRNAWKTRAIDRDPDFDYVVFYEKPYVVWHHDNACLRLSSDESYGTSECVAYIYTKAPRTVELGITSCCEIDTTILIQSGDTEQEEELATSDGFRHQVIPVSGLLPVGFNVLRLRPTQARQCLVSDLEVLPKDMMLHE